MNITKLEMIENNKFKVYIDDQYAFVLYQKDLEQYQLSEGIQLTPELYHILEEDLVLARAKQKALAILKFMDRCERELRSKLSEAGYTGSIIDRAIQYVYDYGYLDDERFASSYVRSRMNRKSKLAIKTELVQKGVSRDIIDLVLEQEYCEEESEDPELVAIKRAIQKKTKQPEELSYEDKQKLIASLYRKGFDLSKIKQLLS